MQVAQVCPLFPFHGGMETHIKTISERLISHGIDVQIFTTDPFLQCPRQTTVEMIDVFKFKSYALKNMYFFSPQLYLALRNLKHVDIVHAHGYNTFPTLAAVLAKSVNKKPLAFTPHYGGYSEHVIGTSYLRTLAKRCYNLTWGRRIFHHVDAIVSVGSVEREFILRKFGVHKQKTLYIPNGVKAGSDKRSWKTRGPIKTLLYVGRMEKYKGVEALLRAFSKIAEAHSNLRLVYVGRGSYKERMKFLVHKSKLEERVHFFENVTDEELEAIYQTADIFVTLPQHETFGISVVEAMAHGLPVIASKVGELSRIVKHGKTGFLLDFPPNVESLAQLIKSLIANSDFSREIGRSARKDVLSKFSWSRSVQDLIRLYERISQEAES